MITFFSGVKKNITFNDIELKTMHSVDKFLNKNKNYLIF